MIAGWNDLQRRRQQTSAIAHASLDVTLRLEDGYVPGAAYLPVAILGQDEYAFITLTIGSVSSASSPTIELTCAGRWGGERIE